MTKEAVPKPCDCCAALAALEPYLDAIACYASTMGEHEPNGLIANARAALGGECRARNSRSSQSQLGPWDIRPCTNAMGHITSYDICLPADPGAKGVGVIASVFAGEDVARLFAASPELLDTLDALCHGIGPKLWDNARAVLAKAREGDR